MLCRNPYMSPTGSAHGCGQCMPCRMNVRRVWMHRIMLEAAQYSDNCFATLSYDDDHLPEGATLVPKHYQDFLKRLRARIAPQKLRFYLVGEYGEKSGRPHYHAALFGFATCRFGQSRYSKVKSRCCERCELVREVWGHGNIYLGTLEDDSAGYMARYVTKKMTKHDDPRLLGRYPEFGRMSLRPGIGGDAMWDIASALMQYELDSTEPDVPTSLRHGKKLLPLGRYCRRRLRKFIGHEENAPQAVVDQMAAEVLPLRVAARASKDDPSVKSHLIRAGDGKVAQMEARNKVFKRKDTL